VMVPNFAKIGRNFPEIWPIFDFQDGGRPPSWICFTRVGTTHEEYLVVFVTVQNLVVIVAVISIVISYANFNILHLKLKNAYSRPQNRGFLGTLPPKWEAVCTTPEKAHPWAETRRMTYRSSKSVHLCGLGASRRIKQTRTHQEMR